MKLLALLALTWSALLAAPVFACGVSGPDGVWSCSLAEHDEEVRPRWMAGASALYTATALRFGDGLRGDETRGAVLASASYAPTAALSFQVSAGAAFGGTLSMPDGQYAFSPGPTGALGATYRLLKGQPFLTLSGVLSGTTAKTRGDRGDRTRYTAFDLRLGAACGVTFWDAVSPYAVARVFGGPVFWRYQGESRTGTDASHVQLGVGLSALVKERVNLFIEAIPLGERAFSGGAALVF
jgi:hypothetical protein